jgi:hypothetical protein
MPSKYGFETDNDKRNLEKNARDHGIIIGRGINSEVRDLLSDLAQAQNLHEKVWGNVDNPDIYFFGGKGHICSWWIKTGTESVNIHIELTYLKEFSLEVTGWGISIDQFCMLCDNLCKMTGLGVDLNYGVGAFTKHWSGDSVIDDDDNDNNKVVSK